MKLQTNQKESPSTGKGRPRRALALLLIAAVLGGGAAGWLHLRGRQDPKDAELQTAFASRMDVTRTLTGTGTLAPIQQFKITPLVTGKVLECTFEEGDQVEEGQLLYRVDPSQARKEIEQAQLSLRQTQLAAGQQSGELEKLTVRAEQAGTVLEVFVKAGDTVEAGTKLATLRESATMLLTIPFNAADAAGFTAGQAATVTVGGSFETLGGTVRSVDTAQTVGDGFQVTRNVTIAVPNPGALSPSATGTAVIGGVAGNSGVAFAYGGESTLTAGVSGKVEELFLTKGSVVAAGGVAARLSSPALRAQLENNAISIQQAQVNLTNAQAGLDNYNITAPISGTVVSREVKAGDTLGSGSGTSTMAIIYDLSALTFTISLDELDRSKVLVGQPVEIRVDALDGQVFQGRVTRISMVGNTEKGKTAYPVTIQIDNPPAQLLPGMNVNASIVIAKAANVLTVPITAVQYGDIVYVKNKPGQAPGEQDGAPEGFHSVPVETGVSDGAVVEIKSGLQEEDEVYLPADAAPADSGADDPYGDDMADEGMIG